MWPVLFVVAGVADVARANSRLDSVESMGTGGVVAGGVDDVAASVSGMLG